MKRVALPLAAFAIAASFGTAFAQSAPGQPTAPAVQLPPVVAPVAATNFVFLAPLLAAPLAFGVIASNGNATTSTTSTTN